jgi:fumarylacetoacetate (FAA) hydrolase
MKLATYKDSSRDGQLVVVSRDLSTAHYATGIAGKLQQVLDDWNFMSPQLQDLYETLNNGKARHAFPFEPSRCMAPLPRAYQWADGSAFINHVELVRKARNAEVPESFYGDPLMYQGGSDDFIGACDDVVVASEDFGIDFEAEVAVITGDVPMGATPAQALEGVRLLMLVNDVSLRNLIPDELAKGFGFVQSKPATAFSPVAVTLDEVGDAWEKGPPAHDPAKHLERPQGRHVRGRPRDDLSLRPADRPPLQDPQCARRQHRRLRHRQQQGLEPRLQLHRRKTRDRNHRRRQAQNRIHEVRRHDPH